MLCVRKCHLQLICLGLGPMSLIKVTAQTDAFLHFTTSVEIQVNPRRDYLCQQRLTIHVISSQVGWLSLEGLCSYSTRSSGHWTQKSVSLSCVRKCSHHLYLMCNISRLCLASEAVDMKMINDSRSAPWEVQDTHHMINGFASCHELYWTNTVKAS